MNINYFEHQEMIAANLVNFLRLRGMSKLSLAKQTGIPRLSIDQILSGESTCPKQYNSQITKINYTFGLLDHYFITTLASANPAFDQGYSGKDPLARELLDGLEIGINNK
ncbi:hypothetical protein [Paenibacillus piscarius]|uniref:hypothetical protein n=1 Tax=Paenibacillus piscarius TaxID=1089681 RepID=UPI001EE7C88C|nr:hypothetical protein [Paenibacillus piscarius]